MTLYSAADLNEQLFQYLLQRHFRLKEAGKEFYFCTEVGYSYKQGIFLTDDEKITLTFWDNDFVNPVETSPNRVLGDLQYKLNLSISFDGRIWFWMPVATLGPWESFEKKISQVTGLTLNKVHNCWERNYSTGGNYQEGLGTFFSESFDIIQKIIAETFPPEKMEKKSGELQTIRQISLFDFKEMIENALRFRNITDNWRPKDSYIVCRLLSFEFWNFRGIRHLCVDNIPATAKWIFLTGENGLGKSSVLQALTLGLAGTEDLPKNEIGDNWLIAVEAVNFNQNEVLTLYGAVPAQSGSFWKSYFAAYGSARLQISGGTEPLRQNERSTLHIFSQNQALLNIENELIRAQSYRPEQFKHIVGMIKKLIPDLADIRIVTTGHFEEVQYFEKDRDGGTYEPVKFSQLAAGFRNLIGFIGDMYLRLNAGQPEPVPPEKLTGIVLIDEIELHLHPKYQKMLPGKLSEIFPKVQFIASTHSPIPLLGAPKESIILTVSRTPETGIIVKKVDVDFSTLLPNAILTSPVFGFDEILPTASSDPGEVETADSYESAKQTQDLKQKLKILKAKMNTN